MLALVLLYVGGVLVLNGIWLLGGIGDREISVINIFAGGIAFIASVVALTVGIIRDAFPLIASAAFVLLFAFTYLWVAINRYLNPDGRGLGWYCLFVALTAAPTSWVVLRDALPAGDTWLIWLGASWGAWAILWFLYFLLLAVGLNIRRLAGYVTVFEGVATSWVPAYLALAGILTIPGPTG
jgi:putative amide transporter protein